MRAEIKLTDVKDIRDLHEYINAELRLRRVAPTLEALQAALEMPKTEAEIEFTDYGKISGALLDYVNKVIEVIVIVGEKNPNVQVMITMLKQNTDKAKSCAENGKIAPRFPAWLFFF